MITLGFGDFLLGAGAFSLGANQENGLRKPNAELAFVTMPPKLAPPALPPCFAKALTNSSKPISPLPSVSASRWSSSSSAGVMSNFIILTTARSSATEISPEPSASNLSKIGRRRMRSTSSLSMATGLLERPPEEASSAAAFSAAAFSAVRRAASLSAAFSATIRALSSEAVFFAMM